MMVYLRLAPFWLLKRPYSSSTTEEV